MAVKGEGEGEGGRNERTNTRERAGQERVEFAARVKGGTRSTRDARIHPLDILDDSRPTLFLSRQGSDEGDETRPAETQTEYIIIVERRFTADRLPKAPDASLVKHDRRKEDFIVIVFSPCLTFFSLSLSLLVFIPILSNPSLNNPTFYYWQLSASSIRMVRGHYRASFPRP